MKSPFISTLREWRAVVRFGMLDPEQKAVVFYSEGPESAPHLTPILRELLGVHEQPVRYVTSDPADPVLNWSDDQLTTFVVGTGAARSSLFSNLRANVLAMTTPDLQTSQIKRSKHDVHYVYVHHAINSMHMAYRPAAFDHFDAILCVGPHHEEEIRQTEAAFGLPKKILVQHGYGRLDSIIASTANSQMASVPSSDVKRVLIAPSWGEQALMETCGEELIEIVLHAGHHVTLRPHPMTHRHRSALLGKLENRYRANERFHLDRDVVSEKSLYDSDIMIGDWGGMSLEYAFGLQRPIISIDLPRKVNNLDYEIIPNEPLEVTLRPCVGAVVSPENISEIPSLINVLCTDTGGIAARARNLRERYVFNIGRSGSVGAEYIVSALRTTPGSDVANV